MEDKILTIPAVAPRGMTILPGMVAHFDISRDKSLRAVEEAMKGDQKLFIVTQKDTEKDLFNIRDYFADPKRLSACRSGKSG